MLKTNFSGHKIWGSQENFGMALPPIASGHSRMPWYMDEKLIIQQPGTISFALIMSLVHNIW